MILKDVNEFNPEFNQTIYSASLKENDVIGTPVLTVSVHTRLLKIKFKTNAQRLIMLIVFQAV